MKSLILLVAALTALSTSNPLPAPAPAMPTQYAQPTENNQLFICRDGQKSCEVHYIFYNQVQQLTNQKGYLNIDKPIKKMAMHPSADLNCTLFFYDSCRYGESREKSPQGVWWNVYHGLVAPGIEGFDTEEWHAKGFFSTESSDQPPKSVMCFPKTGAKGMGV